MIAIRLEENLVKGLDYIANRESVNRSVVIRKAVVQFLEDHEDFQLAMDAKLQMKSAKSLAQLRKELGLDG